jgi:AcrR family transcriptional regulator
MDATLLLVLERGYDGLQMRDVAAAAQVSTRTLYNHFPSKEHLLLAALVERGEGRDQLRGDIRSTGGTAAERVRETLTTPTEALIAVPAIATGMAKALVSGQPSIAPILREFRDLMIDAIVQAIRPGSPTEHDRAIARALQRVWFTAVVAWASGIETPESVLQAIDEALALMMPAGAPRRPR